MLRRAHPADAPALVELWAEMFEEMGAGGGDPELRTKFRSYLDRKLPTGEFLAWLVEEDGQPLATASVILYEIPGRGDVTHEAYAINVFTVPRARGRKLASALMEAIKAHVATLPVRRLWLRTAPLARPVYERAGFQAATDFLVLDFNR